MSKLRYIPYGYTVRNGRTVIDRKEAEIVREIFESYIEGATLESIADKLTKQKVPYTEKVTAWDKSRVARIIGNARYLDPDGSACAAAVLGSCLDGDVLDGGQILVCGDLAVGNLGVGAAFHNIPGNCVAAWRWSTSVRGSDTFATESVANAVGIPWYAEHATNALSVRAGCAPTRSVECGSESAMQTCY